MTISIEANITDPDGPGVCSAASSNMSVTVNALPTLTLNDPADVCVDGANMSFIAGPAGGLLNAIAWNCNKPPR